MKFFKVLLKWLFIIAALVLLLSIIIIMLPVNSSTAQIKSLLDKSLTAVKSHFAVVSSSLANFISGFEGYSSKAYHDSIDPLNVWTIGFGSVFNFEQNRPVQKGDIISKDTAINWLTREAESKFNDVTTVVNVPINDNQLIALSSFAYQFGIGAFNGSTLLRLLNNGTDLNIVANEFDKWIYSNGKVVNGIKLRMAQTKKLFLS